MKFNLRSFISERKNKYLIVYGGEHFVRISFDSHDSRKGIDKQLDKIAYSPVERVKRKINTLFSRNK